LQGRNDEGDLPDEKCVLRKILEKEVKDVVYGGRLHPYALVPRVEARISSYKEQP
jgi:hypothetical protein